MRGLIAIGSIGVITATSGCSPALDVGDYVGVSAHIVAACLAVVNSEGARESAGPTTSGPPTTVKHDTIRVSQTVEATGPRYDISGRTVFDFDGDLDVYTWECSVEVNNETTTLTASLDSIELG